MTTPADALEVMTIVAACHHRTAPRMDDPEAAFATAKIWSELFDGYDFTTAELIAAVKHRAKSCPDAPEAADIIRVARATRTDQMARAVNVGTTHVADEHYPGDAKAAPDAAEFPADWDTEKRTAAYWYAMRLHALPRSTRGWQAIAEQIEDAKAKRETA